LTKSLPVELDSAIERLLQQIGYADDPDFVTDPGTLELTQVSHAIEAAFASMGVVGALCPRSSLGSGQKRPVPIVYIVKALDRDDANAKHRAIWSQSVVPVLIVATPTNFQIRNGFDYRAGSDEWPWAVLAEKQLPAQLVSLTSSAIRSAAAWGNFKMPTRVDERLGKAIRELSKDVGSRAEHLRSRPDIINSAIGRFLYLYMLADRGILDQHWIDSLRTAAGRTACPDIHLDEAFEQDGHRPAPWPARQVWLLFDAIDDVLNGSIFPLSRRERGMLDTSTLHLIRRALRSDTLEDGTHQYGFLDVNYATIRTETVSAIYECFFELEAGEGKREQGAFYTPPFLVDYILDELNDISPMTPDSTLADPASGSGAFLVGGFRRIIEGERRAGRAPDARRLHEILSTNIFGIELKQQAANVSRFSLYLTMLDYLPGVTLTNVAQAMEGGRLFPDLRDRLVVRDTFQRLPANIRNSATHVVGNPPWTQIEGESSARRYRDKLIRSATANEPPFVGPSGTMAEAFFWRAINDICAPDGRIAFVLPTKSFIAPKARCFPLALASRVTLHGITNLAHFRERLFTNAREAATVVFATATKPDPFQKAWRYSPKASSQPVGQDGTLWAIVVDRGQVEWFRQIDLLAEEHEWFRDLMLQPLDRMLASMLQAPRDKSRALTIGGFLGRQGMHVRQGDGATRIGLPNHLVLNAKSNDYRLRLGLLPGTVRDYELPPSLLGSLSEIHQAMFRGPMVLMTRNQSDFHVIDRAAAYSSSLIGLYFETEEIPHDRRLAVLDQIAAYLQTSVAKYLLALFGRLWVFDQRRFDTPDLRRLPFPYRDYHALLDNPVTGFSDQDFTAFCQKAFRIDDIFQLAVTEHHELREKYQDGKRPAEGSRPVPDLDRSTYERVLKSQLSELLAGAPVDIKRDLTSPKTSIAFRVIIDPSGEFKRLPEPGISLQVFAEEGTIDLYDREGLAIANVIKPNMLAAWTAERAYADALAVARRILTA
jgi:hypothetical protein